MRSDGPSVPTRGSRLVGLLSIIITRVWGSVRCEQERLQPTRSVQVTESAIRVKRLAELRSGIGDLSQHGGLLRAGGGRNVGGPLVPGFICKQGKGCGLF